MLTLIISLFAGIGVKHGEYLWLPQNGPITRYVDNVGIDVRPYLVDWLDGKIKPTKDGLVPFKTFTPTPTEFGSYFLFERKFGQATAKFTCMLNDTVVNAPKIYGIYEDDYVYIWGINFKDTYQTTPKVYLVTDAVTELVQYNPPGDRQGKQTYYESPYLIRVKPPTSGKIVVYSGELGLWGCDWIEYKKKEVEYTPLSLGETYTGNVTVRPGQKLVGPITIDGCVTLQDGAAMENVTINKNQPYCVRTSNNTEIRNCRFKNNQDEGVCVQISGGQNVRLIDNSFEGVRACGVTSKVVERCLTLRNSYKGLRYATSGAYFPLGVKCVIADNSIRDAYRAFVGQANSGPILQNLIIRNDISDGGIDPMGGEQIILETKADTFLLNLSPNQTVMVVDGPGKGQYWVQTPSGPDRPITVTDKSKYVMGNIATENLLILNRITNCRVGVELWKNSAGNIVSGLQCTNVPWGFVQNAGAKHGYAFGNELRDSFFQNSSVVLTNNQSNNHWLNFSLNRVEFINSTLRSYNIDGGTSGEGLFMFKCAFGSTDPIPLGEPDAKMEIPLYYKPIMLDSVNHVVKNDCIE